MVLHSLTSPVSTLIFLYEDHSRDRWPIFSPRLPLLGTRLYRSLYYAFTLVEVDFHVMGLCTKVINSSKGLAIRTIEDIMLEVVEAHVLVPLV